MFKTGYLGSWTRSIFGGHKPAECKSPEEEAKELEALL